MFDLNKLVREAIRNLKPNFPERDAHTESTEIIFDTNENPFGSPVAATTGTRLRSHNRYPDPLQIEVKEKLSKIKGVPAGNIFIGNGSDEIIDLLYRTFCNPGKDNVIIPAPTYERYEWYARLNDVAVRKVPLTKEFQPDAEAISEMVDSATKLMFICSPNNPTGNSMDREEVEFILNNFEGIVVIDEAYINYSRQRSFIGELTEYPNLVVMQTLSAAWGMAGARIAMAYASDAIIGVLNTVKPLYNVSSPAQQVTLEALDNINRVNERIRATVQERTRLTAALGRLASVQKIYPSDANFLLVKFDDAAAVHVYLRDHGIHVSDQSKVEGCEGCLRITIGTPEENAALIEQLLRK
jgi:histidinol-phosphate aminotransferase